MSKNKAEKVLAEEKARIAPVVEAEIKAEATEATTNPPTPAEMSLEDVETRAVKAVKDVEEACGTARVWLTIFRHRVEEAPTPKAATMAEASASAKSLAEAVAEAVKAGNAEAIAKASEALTAFFAKPSDSPRARYDKLRARALAAPAPMPAAFRGRPVG